MGVGAVFLAMIAKEELEEVYEGKPAPVALELINPVVLFIVLASTLVHGTTIPLFKIGNRIRTRTLSVTSTGSNQVLRLPKIQFGQQLGRKSADDGDRRSRHSHHEGMTEVQRNTIINTLQQQERMEAAQKQSGDSGSGQTATDTDYAAIDMQHQPHNLHEHNQVDDDDDFAEEDFLPGGDDEDDGNTMAPHSIRFLEPVNPRTTIGSSSSPSANSTNMEKNEHSVSSFRGWLHRNKDVAASPVTTPSADENAVNPLGEGDALQRQPLSTTPKRQKSPELDPKHLNINVWDEENHIIVEDTDGTRHEVVDKSGDWKPQVHAVIDTMEKDIAKDTE